MLKPKSPKDSDYIDEDLIGKSIVDPNGDIIAKCIGVFEDEKKKKQMKIAIKTEIESEFIVNETIPLSLINKVGEVILLKRSLEIQPVSIEDIVMIEYTTAEQSNMDKSDPLLKSPTTEKEQEKNQMKNENNNQENKENIAEKEKIQTFKKEKKTSNKIIKTKKQEPIHFANLFNELIQEDDTSKKKELIDNIISLFNKNEKFKNEVLEELFVKTQTSDYSIRLITSEIFHELCLENYNEIKPMFLEVLKSAYNEPSFDIAEKFIENLFKIATKEGIDLLTIRFEDFFDKLYIGRIDCKNISLQRIHNINLKVFINNFYVQEILAEIYLKQICDKCENSQEFSEFLGDINALIIAFSILKVYDSKYWEKLRKTKVLNSTLNDSYINLIDNIIEYYNKSNIKKLTEIIDPKIGMYFTNRLIANMIKDSIKEVLSNVTTISLDVLCEFYFDDNNRIIQIVFDLINRREIEAEILFVEDKTFISLIQ